VSKTAAGSNKSQTSIVEFSSLSTKTSNPASSTGPSGNVASVTPTGGAQLLRAGTAVGALGLVVGFVL